VPLLNETLKKLLVCPACHSDLDEDDAASQLRCRPCGRAYPVREFPIMLIEESTIVDAQASGASKA